MPQITVDHSESVTPALDRAVLATKLHAAIVAIAEANPEACKTQFRSAPFTAVGHDVEGHAVVHISIALLAGRTDGAKAELAQTALDLLRRHIGQEGAVHASVEIRDLDPSYRKFDT